MPRRHYDHILQLCCLSLSYCVVHSKNYPRFEVFLANQPCDLNSGCDSTIDTRNQWLLYLALSPFQIHLKCSSASCSLGSAITEVWSILFIYHEHCRGVRRSYNWMSNFTMEIDDAGENDFDLAMNRIGSDHLDILFGCATQTQVR